MTLLRSILAAATVAVFAAIAAVAPVEATVHWVPWPPSFYDSAELLISSTEPNPTEAWIEGEGMNLRIEIGSTLPARVSFPVELRIQAGGLFPSRALRVSSEAELTVLLQIPSTESVPDSTLWTSHDIARIPAEHELGTSYTALAWPSDGRCYGPFGEEPCADSWVAVTATRSGTLLDLGPGDCTNEQSLGPMEPGDVFVLRCTQQGEDVTGLQIEANSPVLALSGSVAARLPSDGGSADNLLATLPPRVAWDREYYAIPTPKDPFFSLEGDHMRVVGEPGELVTVTSESLSREFAIPTQGILEIEGADGNSGPLRIEAAGPVLVGQLLKSRNHRGLGDPSLMILAGSGSGRTVAQWGVPDGYGEGYALGLVAPVDAELALDGGPGIALEPLPGGSHGYAVLELEAPVRGTADLHAVRSDLPFSAWMVGLGIFKSYAHSLGWRAPHILLRGERADSLSPVAFGPESPWADSQALAPGAGDLLFYEVRGVDFLWVSKPNGDSIAIHF